MMKNKIFLFLLLLCTGISGIAQEWKYSYTYRHFGIRDGLLQSQVFASFQDSYGYLWFSTYEGVSRFDGLHFENYSGNDLQLNNTRVKYFNQYESAVYMVSSNNIVFVYPDRSIEHYPMPDKYLVKENELALVGDDLYLFNSFHQEQRGLNKFALFRFNLKNKTVTKLAEDLPFLQTCVSGGKIYAATQVRPFTLFRMDGERLQKIREFEPGKEVFHLHFIRTRQNEWFATMVQNRSSSTFHFHRCLIENDSLQWDYLIQTLRMTERIECIDKHRYYVSDRITPNSWSQILDTEKRRLLPFPLDLFMVNNLLIDRDGNFWFSTEDGVYQYLRTFFELYQLKLGRNDNIWSVIRDSRDNVWFSSYGYGLWRVDPQGRLHQVKIIHNHLQLPVKGGYMSNCEDSRGRIFLTTESGVTVFDPQQGDPDRLKLFKTGTSLAVYHDVKNGDIYFGGMDSCSTLNVLRADGKLSVYPFDYRHIISIGRDGNRNLRIGTFYGEARLDEEKQKIVADTAQRNYLGLISMDLDENGILWKATMQGIFAEDRTGKDRQLFDKQANFVLHYKNQYIIWGEKDNLYLLDLPAYHRDSTVTIRTFGFYDGFNLLECGQNGASIDHEGYVWVAGGDKAIRFLPEQIMKTPPLQACMPYIAAIYNADKNSSWSIVDVDCPVQLENSANYLRFDILQASVSAPDKLNFRYRLNGYTRHWTVSRDRSLIFQNVPHGRFYLEVQSSVNGEDWSESVFSPSIVIRNPFWLTVPGLLLLFLAILGITLLIIYCTRKISIRKEEELRMIEQLKHRAVQAKFIPHFTGNVLNSINYLISKNPDLAQKYVSDFAGFSHQTLLSSNNLCRTIRDELDYVQLYLKLEKLRFEDKLEYIISIAPEADLQKMIPTMALQTFCENALKHGLRLKSGVGVIAIRVYPKTDYLVLSVEDNGIGREQARMIKTEGTKEGLKIVQQQLDIFNKRKTRKASLQIIDLFDENGLSSGTRFELLIP